MPGKYDVAIIGGGPGGYTAALYCVRAGFSTVVLEKLSAGGQMANTDVVDNYPGFPDGVNGFDLGEKMQAGAERFGAVTEYAEVSSVDFSDDVKKIESSEGLFEARAVIVATGADPRELGLDGEKEMRGHGMAYCAACDGMGFKGKDVMVVGGGNSAIADVLYLAKICPKVYLVHRRNELRASKVYLDPLEKIDNVEFIWDSKVSKIIYEDKISAVVVENLNSGEQKEIPIAGLFAAVGRVPDTKMYEGILNLDKGGYIIADESTLTNIPGVYAVGDVRTKKLRQIVTAVADGAVASEYIIEYLS